MGQRASQPSGRSPTSQGRVRSANISGTLAWSASIPFGSTSGILARRLSRGRCCTLALNPFSAVLALSGRCRRAICCTVTQSDQLELTEHFTSRFCAVMSQLRKNGGVSFVDARPAIGLTFDTRSLSLGCDRETNTESQGDLSCRRKRTRLPRSVRLPHENRASDRIW